MILAAPGREDERMLIGRSSNLTPDLRLSCFLAVGILSTSPILKEGGKAEQPGCTLMKEASLSLELEIEKNC